MNHDNTHSHYKAGNPPEITSVCLGAPVTLQDLVAVARHGAAVTFSEAYCSRVARSRSLVERWIAEGRIMYGITTGFGALCTSVISVEETARLQRNIILTHATAVGEPLPVEVVRAVLFAMLQNMGQGYSGVRLELLEHIRQLLNAGVTPFAPREGSVGYLSVEGHIGLTLIGMGRAYYRGVLMETAEAFRQAGLEPIVLAAKEGLALISGTTSPTALASLALYDMLGAAKAADIIGAMTLEVSRGTVKAFDERLMQTRPYEEQCATASNVRRLLGDSGMAQQNAGYRLQDALSLRAIPQLHGAAKRYLHQARVTLEQELNSCNDNPVIWPEGDDGLALSGCHCDSSYVGISMDTAAIAATMIAKMSERRNFRLLTESLSEMPWFLIRSPGLNSGLMIPQYTQAGLLNDMKILSHPASVDGIPTCGGQEDYVAMGYNAAKKAVAVVEKLEYILAIELLSVYQAQQFRPAGMTPGPASEAVLALIGEHVPVMEEDLELYPYLETLRRLIREGALCAAAEAVTGPLA